MSSLTYIIAQDLSCGLALTRPTLNRVASRGDGLLGGRSSEHDANAPTPSNSESASVTSDRKRLAQRYIWK